MSMYTSGDWHVKPGQEDRFVEMWQQFARSTTQDLTTQMPAHLLRDSEDRSHFVSFGEWPDRQTIDQWRGSDVFQQQITQLKSLTDSWDIKAFDVAAELQPAQVR